MAAKKTPWICSRCHSESNSSQRRFHNGSFFLKKTLKRKVREGMSSRKEQKVRSFGQSPPPCLMSLFFRGGRPFLPGGGRPATKALYRSDLQRRPGAPRWTSCQGEAQEESHLLTGHPALCRLQVLPLDSLQGPSWAGNNGIPSSADQAGGQLPPNTGWSRQPGPPRRSGGRARRSTFRGLRAWERGSICSQARCNAGRP